MKTKKVNRYYCDYCKKSGGSAGHMKKHERGCTMNPERVCGVCKLVDAEQGPLDALVILLGSLLPTIGDSTAVDKALPQLRAAANDCPACILAALRQAGVVEHAHDFHWKDEMEGVWSEFNDSGRE